MARETQPGQVIGGRYHLVAKLGSGGFGKVWRARDTFLDVEVAVKEVWMPPSLSAQEQNERLARAEREARNAAKLRGHPNIVAVYDVVVEDGVPWTVMQLIDGISLEEHLTAHGPLSEDGVTTIARAMLGALGAAHEAGVVHRDVKPANIMLAANGGVLLTDFGIAVHQADSALTATGLFVGSVEYIAPERARGAEGRAESDLFSLGVTLYQAAEGVSPFHRETPTGSLTAVLFEDPPRPQRAGRVAPVINALIAKDPVRRPNVADALALLDGRAVSAAPATVSAPTVSTDVPTVPLMPTLAPTGQTKPRKAGANGANKAFLAIAGAGVAVAIAIVAIVMTQSSSNRTPTAGSTTASSNPSTPSAPQTSVNLWTAKAGDCLHGLTGGVSNGEFSASVRLVPCSSPEANYTVIKQIASDLGSDCGGGPVVYDFTQHTGEHELCIEPKQ